MIQKLLIVLLSMICLAQNTFTMELAFTMETETTHFKLSESEVLQIKNCSGFVLLERQNVAFPLEVNLTVFSVLENISKEQEQNRLNNNE